MNRMRKTLKIEVLECNDLTFMEEGWAGYMNQHMAIYDRKA